MKGDVIPYEKVMSFLMKRYHKERSRTFLYRTIIKTVYKQSMNDVIFIGIDGNDELVSKKQKSVDDDDDDELLSKEQKSETHGEGCFNCSCIDDEHLDCDHDRNAFEYADL